MFKLRKRIKKIKRSFTLLEMIIILIIVAFGGQIIFQMYKTMLDYMWDNQIYKNDSTTIGTLNNLYAFTNNFFDECTYKDDNTVECTSKKSEHTFNIIIQKTHDIQKLVLEDKDVGRSIVLATIGLEQTIRKNSYFKMRELTDTLAALEYRTGIGKKYIMVFPYNN